MFTDKEARELLQTFKVPKDVIEHSQVVHDTCMNLVVLLNERKPHVRINRRLVSVASLLHDIGRSKSQGIDHGIVGAKMISDLNVKNDPQIEKIAKICERHLGGGIS